ncbi:hypothetical protein CHARACLAT_004002 [Characodon lateralis]|uniref:Uncharacterized protein n=1 Tax=Characodon lateralis TaxID=208331 RepID=A0ABU7CK87_9TELE|nr:hypothetical protein [Characodon lateralis]
MDGLGLGWNTNGQSSASTGRRSVSHGTTQQRSTCGVTETAGEFPPYSHSRKSLKAGIDLTPSTFQHR